VVLRPTYKMKKFNTDDIHLHKIIRIINSIQVNNSRLNKESILRDNINNILFKDILYFIYNPYIITGLSDKKINKKVKISISFKIESITDLIKYFEINNTGTDADIANVQNYLNSKSENVKDLF
jgi:DNA ligase-1